MTLIDSGQLPETPHFPDPLQTWPDLLAALDEVISGRHDFRTVVIDTVNGAERLCHEMVCQQQFGNDWGKEGFLSFGQGPRSSLTAFSELLKRLDRCRELGMGVILLAHSAPRGAKNPEGADYERWEPVLDRSTSSLLARWCDMILFGAFEVVTTAAGKGQRAKAKGQTRLIRTEPNACWEAGNRHGLPEDIECGENAAEAWANFVKALKQNKKGE